MIEARWRGLEWEGGLDAQRSGNNDEIWAGALIWKSVTPVRQENRYEQYGGVERE